MPQHRYWTCVKASNTPHLNLALHRKVATVDPWAGDLPPGSEFRQLRRRAGNVSQEAIAHDGGTSVLSIWRYETGRTTTPRSMDSPEFRRVVTALYELAVERDKLAAQQELLRRALADGHGGTGAAL